MKKNTRILSEKDKLRLGELLMFKRLITEVYPSGIVSLVMDTYDLWNTVKKGGILDTLKDKILARDGKVVIRPDCYDEDTQVFTDKGWKFFKDLTKHELIAQVNNDGTQEFVKPLKYFNEEYKGEMVRLKDFHGKLDLLVTPNHRMIYKKGAEFREQTAEKFSCYWSKNIVRSAPTKDKGEHLSALDRIKIAFQADGSYQSSGDNIRFSFSKKRKIDRLKDLLLQAGIDYSIYYLKDGSVEFNVKLHKKNVSKKSFYLKGIPDLCANWCKEFIEEASYWDGTRRSPDRLKLDTTNEKIAKELETIAFCAGYGVLLSEREDDRKECFSKIFTLHILTLYNEIGGQSIKKTTEQYNGRVYCVTVPSGRLLVKRGRGTAVCGNSGDPVLILCGYTEGDRKQMSQEAWDKLSEWEKRGVVECLWDLFGGSLSSTGYKVLSEKIGTIYGDSITIARCEEICQRLVEKGFASTNIVLGIGSFTYQGAITPDCIVTRDSFGVAIKSTYGEVNGVGREIFKDPVTDNGLKKSAKGLIAVYDDDPENGYRLKDQATWDEVLNCAFLPLFKDGIWDQRNTLDQIRARIRRTG